MDDPDLAQRVLTRLLLLTGVWITAALFTPQLAANELCVHPSEEVQSAVAIRRTPTTAATQVARLLPEARAAVIGEVPHWYRVAGTEIEGFISKAWTELVPCEAVASDAVYTVHVIDVGTGLAVFVAGEDFSLLYDAGSKDDTASGDRNRVLAYLQQVAPDLATLDHVVISHPHDDHMSLLPDVFDRYEVRNVWHSGAAVDTCIYRTIINAVASEPNVRVHTGTLNYGHGLNEFEDTCSQAAEDIWLSHGGRITTEPVSLGFGAFMQFLYTDGKSRTHPNDNSLILRLDLGAKRVLLTGDAGGGEREAFTRPPTARSIEGILAACCERELKADVLIVGHHGSKTSSRAAFLDAVDARHYIVSSGPYAYSGVVLPDKEVLRALRSRGEVWSTDEQDRQCLRSESKIGPTADNNPGGCHNVVVRIGRNLRLSYAPGLPR
jgi:beta-lactamase superfamily II metal-dependent hydrolase